MTATGEPAAREVEAVVAMGTNLGDREQTLRGAVALMRSSEGIVLQGVSQVVETDPVGGPEQPDYLNAVIVVATTLSPHDLLDACHRIEAAFGRERSERWGARTLDLDVIAYGRPGSPSEVVSDDPGLTLPHPRAHERAFVLAPWCRLQPEARLRLPSGEVRRVADLLAVAADRDGVRAAQVGALQ
jgi:2-amino-4-hydroxy-6-hydroxymethyldihydropteridine diphosphokinase